MSKFPKLSKPKLLKAQVTQSSSCPNYQKSKLPQVKKTYCSPMAKIIHGPAIAKNVSRPPMTKTSFPNCQSPSYSKSKSPKAQVTQSSSHPKLKSPKAQVTQSPSCPQVKKNSLLSHDQEYSWPCNSQNYF